MKAAAAAAIAVLVVAGCSGSTSGPSAGSTHAAGPSTAPACDAACISSIRAAASAPPSTPITSSTEVALSAVDLDAKDWLDTNRLHIELMLARAAAAERATAGGQAAEGPCTDLVDAAFVLDDVLPHFGTELNSHPMIHDFIEASSQYTLAGNACALYADKQVRRYFAHGDALIASAKVEARRLKTTI